MILKLHLLVKLVDLSVEMLELDPFYSELSICRFCSTLELQVVSRNIIDLEHGKFDLILLRLYRQLEELHLLTSKQLILKSKIKDVLENQLN